MILYLSFIIICYFYISVRIIVIIFVSKASYQRLKTENTQLWIGSLYMNFFYMIHKLLRKLDEFGKWHFQSRIKYFFSCLFIMNIGDPLGYFEFFFEFLNRSPSSLFELRPKWWTVLDVWATRGRYPWVSSVKSSTPPSNITSWLQ